MNNIPTGVLSAEATKDMMINGELCIFPFSENLLTSCGYNLTPSDFAFSTKKGVLEQIRTHDGIKYIKVLPYDTVLICTKEYICFPDCLMGTIHSRVAIVSEGFGHISTTVDPMWEGPMLIAINNPSKKTKTLKLNQTIATLVFHSLSERTTKRHDNPPFRLDILEYYLQKNQGWKHILFHSRALKRFKCLIELATESVATDTIDKSKFKELYILEDILSKMSLGEIEQWKAALSQYGLHSLKYNSLSDIFKSKIAELQEAANNNYEQAIIVSKQAYKLCEKEFIYAYWREKSDKLKKEINNNTKNLALINLIASKIPLKIILSLLLAALGVYFIVYIFQTQVQTDTGTWQAVTGFLAVIIAILSIIWK